MAIITRRFSYNGPWPLGLKNSTDTGLVLPATNYRIYYDATFDDDVISVAAFNEQMRKYGCFPDPSDTRNLINGTPTPFVGLVAPDGSVWELTVSNLGILSVIKRSP